MLFENVVCGVTEGMDSRVSDHYHYPSQSIAISRSQSISGIKIDHRARCFADCPRCLLAFSIFGRIVVSCSQIVFAVVISQGHRIDIHDSCVVLSWVFFPHVFAKRVSFFVTFSFA